MHAQAARTGAYEPIGRLDQYGAGLGRLAGFGSTAQPMDTGGASPLATALSTATGIARNPASRSLKRKLLNVGIQPREEPKSLTMQ